MRSILGKYCLRKVVLLGGDLRGLSFLLFTLSTTLYWSPFRRTFGNGNYKWDLKTLQRLQESYLGSLIPVRVKTPPYFTASPVVTTVAIEPGDFLVLASDGLWDSLTN